MKTLWQCMGRQQIFWKTCVKLSVADRERGWMVDERIGVKKDSKLVCVEIF